MKQLHKKFPKYNWAQNKGYATREHQEALDQHGPCKYHRKTFRLSYTEPELFEE
jgi:ribonuclease HII